MDLGLTKRVALISGAAGGIGLATARLLAEKKKPQASAVSRCSLLRT